MNTDDCPDDLSYWQKRDEYEAAGRRIQSRAQRQPGPSGLTKAELERAGEVLDRLAR